MQLGNMTLCHIIKGNCSGPKKVHSVQRGITFNKNKEVYSNVVLKGPFPMLLHYSGNKLTLKKSLIGNLLYKNIINFFLI